MILKTLVFSKNRACQLELLLRSLPYSPSVLYTYDKEFELGYTKLMKMYPKVDFIKQTNFKSQLLEFVQSCKYILFLTDDDVMIETFSENLPEYLEFIKSPDVVSLSLGLSSSVAGKKWKWQKYRNNYRLRMWGYPMSIDSCIFRSVDIIPTIKANNISNPNYLETYLNQNIPNRPYMMCVGTPLIINNAVNQVQNDFPARASGPTAHELEKRFLEGERLSLDEMKKQSKGLSHYRIKQNYKYEPY